MWDYDSMGWNSGLKCSMQFWIWFVINEAHTIELTRIHWVSKNDKPWLAITLHTSTSFNIFGRNVARKVSNKTMLYFPTSPNRCFTTWENEQPGNCVFLLNAVCCFTSKHKIFSDCHFITAEPLFISIRLNLRRKYSMQSSIITYSLVSNLSLCWSLCQKYELFFVKPGVKS